MYADKLAKEAVGPNKMHPFNRLVSQERVAIRKNIHREWEQEWKASIQKRWPLYDFSELLRLISVKIPKESMLYIYAIRT
jgi:hypothetical protein